MSIQLPTIEASYFTGMMACGHLESEPEVLNRLLDGSRHELVAALILGNEQMILVLIVGDKSSKHIHIDLVKESDYRTKEGQSRVTADEIQSRLAPLMGQPIAVSFFGRYRIPVASLPKGGLIDTLKFNVNTNDFSLTVTGSELSITGAPINKLSWKAGNEHVVVDLDGEINTTINKDYLIRLYDFLNIAFEGLVLPGGNYDSM